MRHLVGSVLGLISFAVPLLVAPSAHASLEACGNISLEADAKCTAYVQGGCEAKCQEIKFDAACHAEGYIGCRGQCTANVDASCTASCEVSDCEAKCTAKPAEFDCQANCYASCDADCSGSCSAKCGSDSTCRSQCQGSCRATCQGECKGSCTVNPGEVDCKARCQASCQGQCKAKANLDCQVSCQNNLQVNCETRLEGGCKVKCTEPDGALVCDGEYVDYDNNAKECLDALTSWTEKIKASASGSASCSNGVCTAEGQASCECATAGASDNSAVDAYALFGAGALGIGAVLRRRRRQNEQR